MPGETGPGASFGLQEGFGIPVTAEHKDAAKVFVDWMLEPEHQVELYKGAGFLPCGKTALDQLAKSGNGDGWHVSETAKTATTIDKGNDGHCLLLPPSSLSRLYTEERPNTRTPIRPELDRRAIRIPARSLRPNENST